MVSRLPGASSVPELAQLHDIHIPESVSGWPPALGWYIVAALILLVCIGAGIWGWRYCVNGRAKRQALSLLTQYQQQYQRDKNSQHCSVQISALLRRVALVYYPRAQVAGLRGEAWIAFLNQTAAKQVDFNLVRAQLLELPYQSVNNMDLHLLFTLARAWIKRRGQVCLN